MAAWTSVLAVEMLVKRYNRARACRVHRNCIFPVQIDVRVGVGSGVCRLRR